MSDFNIYKNVQLSKVTEYYLCSDDESVTINVFEIIQGQKAGKFVARPKPLFVKQPQKQFIGKGQTPDEALQNLLDIIGDTELSKIHEEID